jgi:hypothetical protein
VDAALHSCSIHTFKSNPSPATPSIISHRTMAKRASEDKAQLSMPLLREAEVTRACALLFST